MNQKEKSYSSYISDSIVNRKSYQILEKLIGILFKKIDFGKETLLTLDEYSQKGTVVFASYQSTSTSLLILINLLKRNGFKIPVLALGFSPYLFQLITNFFKRLFYLAAAYLKKNEYEYQTEERYITEKIIEGETTVFSFFSTKLFTRRYVERKSDFIYNLLEIQKNTTEPIYIFPQMIFWNRNPERTKTLITSKATGDRSLLAGFFTIMTSITPPFMRVSSPINLKDVLEETKGVPLEQVVQQVRNRIRDIYDNEKRTVLGPVIKSQQEMMEQVLSHENVLEELKKEIENKGKSEKRLRKKAYQYFREIAADFSIVTIKYFSGILESYIFKKLFDGIHYNIEDLKKIREASQKGPVIFMPSHKSHMDYLIISSLFYVYKLVPPHILAGSNLLFFPMGYIFRKSGAFFMRRSFRGLDLYAAVFKQYVKTLINEGYGIEFFIEGGRTRTGKLALPKMGFLKYLIDAIDEGYAKDMVFIPVAINYDRILEENSYHKELKGKKKESETTSAFLKSWRFLKRKHGSVYFSIDEPMSYQELKKQFSDSEDLTSKIAYHVMKKVNNCIIVTPFTLVTSAMFFSSGRGFSREYLKERVTLLFNYLKFMKVDMGGLLKTGSDIDDILDYVLKAYKEDSIITETNLEGVWREESDREETDKKELFYILNEDERTRINLYKNTTIHYLLPAAFVSIAILLNRKGRLTMNILRKDCDFLFELFSKEFIFSGIMENREDMIEQALGFFQGLSVLSRHGDEIIITNNDFEKIRFFARSLQDLFESYLIVLHYVLKYGGRWVQTRDLQNEIRKYGIKMYHKGDIKLSESLSLSNYQNALSMLVGKGILHEQKSGMKNVEVKSGDMKDAEIYREKVLQYIIEINAHPAKGKNNNRSISRDGDNAATGPASDHVH